MRTSPLKSLMTWWLIRPFKCNLILEHENKLTFCCDIQTLNGYGKFDFTEICFRKNHSIWKGEKTAFVNSLSSKPTKSWNQWKLTEWEKKIGWKKLISWVFYFTKNAKKIFKIISAFEGVCYISESLNHLWVILREFFEHFLANKMRKVYQF